ncbi:MAG: hypothetical protein OEM02_11315 [Desulfobulbaceae bacterium]|nr:hypothetical protein [Desulfobulbaceae bacterium]
MEEKRNRAWRRFKNHIKRGKGQGTESKWKPEKKWKMLYLWSGKLARAKQLGIDYPRKNSRQLIEHETTLNDEKNEPIIHMQQEQMAKSDS